MARVFVFNSYSLLLPSIDDFSQLLPPGARVIAYNYNWNQVTPYFMVAFSNPSDTYLKWCDDKDKDIPIVLQDGDWHMRS